MKKSDLAGQSVGVARKSGKADDTLLIISDERNGKEYYMSLLDSFSYNGRLYKVMHNYEPDNGKHQKPEVVIMRSWMNSAKQTFFSSIKDRHELDAVFQIYFDRYFAALARES